MAWEVVRDACDEGRSLGLRRAAVCMMRRARCGGGRRLVIWLLFIRGADAHRRQNCYIYHTRDATAVADPTAPFTHAQQQPSHADTTVDRRTDGRSARPPAVAWPTRRQLLPAAQNHRPTNRRTVGNCTRPC